MSAIYKWGETFTIPALHSSLTYTPVSFKQEKAVADDKTIKMDISMPLWHHYGAKTRHDVCHFGTGLPAEPGRPRPVRGSVRIAPRARGLGSVSWPYPGIDGDRWGGTPSTRGPDNASPYASRAIRDADDVT